MPLVEPGYTELLEFDNHRKAGFRLPPVENVLKNLRELVQYKLDKGLPTLEIQVYCIGIVLDYIRAKENEQNKHILDVQDLVNLQRIFLIPYKGEILSLHLQLIQYVHEYLEHRYSQLHDAFPQYVENEFEKDTPLVENHVGNFEQEAEMIRYITGLCLYGGVAKAREKLPWSLLTEKARKTGVRPEILYPFLKIMRTLSEADNEEELVKFVDKYTNSLFPYNDTVEAIMVEFYARKKNRHGIIKWLKDSRRMGAVLTKNSLQHIMRFVDKTDDDITKEWGETLLRTVCDSNPPKEVWDVVLQWAVIVKDRSLEDIERMLEVMKSFNHKPDIETINGLIAAALEKKDTYRAERFSSNLLQNLDLEPNATTFRLQIEYRLLARDIHGTWEPCEALFDALAREMPRDQPGYEDKLDPVSKWEQTEVETNTQSNISWEKIEQSMAFPTINPHLEHLPTINKYIRALCGLRTEAGAKEAARVGEILEERGLAIEPATAVAMCMMYFEKDRSLDVVDVLTVYSSQYASTDRNRISAAFVDYICDRSHSTARAWDAYQLLRQFFPEITRTSRRRLIEEFIGRRRADMATHVFGHMRGHETSHEGLRPTSDEYVMILEGLGRWPDDESLQLVHNMLKLDPLISYNTRLFNALMIAYGASENPRKAEIFWQDIQNSLEGPTYESLEIAFWIFSSVAHGEEKARNLWRKLHDLEIDIPEKVWRSYVACLFSFSRFDEAFKMINQGCEGIEELSDDTYMVFYDTMSQYPLKEYLDKWLTRYYPKQWARVKKNQRAKERNGFVSFPGMRGREFKA